MDPAVRSARTQSAIITVSAEDRNSRRPERGITGLSSVVLRSKSSRSKNSRGERNFWMQRPEAENRLERPLMPTETERPERYRRISPSKRPNWSQRGILRFGKTGWWCAQSDTNRSPLDIRLRTGNFLQNSANNRLSAGLWRLRIGNLTEIPDSCRQAQALSSYCAKQVVEAEYWH